MVGRWARQWTVVVPIVAAAALAVAWPFHPGGAVLMPLAVLLGAAVLAAVHHAEVVAHQVGEPFGSLVLALAVTAIEVALIVTLMLGGGEGTSSLARDTVFAAIMITCNGIVGISVLVAARDQQAVAFNQEGAAAAFSTVCAVATLSLVLPTFTTSAPARQFTGSQLAFAAVASFLLWAVFVVTQTVRHRDFFLPVDDSGRPLVSEDEHAARPGPRRALVSGALLLVSLVAVVGLAKLESKAIEAGVTSFGLPLALVGVAIALLVLLPESIAAARNARRGRLQTSLNLAYGSAIASIGLTIPTIALASLWIDQPLELGLGSTHLVLLAVTAVMGILTIVPGRATRLQGAIHLVLAAAYLFLSAIP